MKEETISQKRLSTEVVYEFKEKYLKYKVKDSGGMATHNIGYEDISNEITDFEEKNAWFRQVGIYFMLLGGFFFLYNLTIAHKASLPIWVVVGIGFYITYYITSIKYEVIDVMGEVNLLVIKNHKKHDELMRKIFKTRNEYLRNKYYKIDPKENPIMETDKFKWLKNLGVITQREFEKFKKEIEENEKKKRQKKKTEAKILTIN